MRLGSIPLRLLGVFAIGLICSIVACSGGSSGQGASVATTNPVVPAAPAISVPTILIAGTTNQPASVFPQDGVTYTWNISGGNLITSSEGTSIAFEAGEPGDLVLTCTARNATGQSSATQKITVLPMASTGPIISAPAFVEEQSGPHVASIPVTSGKSFVWSIENGSILSGQNTPSITFQCGKQGTALLRCMWETGDSKTLSSSIAVAVLKPASHAYGSLLSSDSLANTRIGGPHDTQLSYRFRAEHTGQLSSMQVYVIWDRTKDGYSNGTGGSLQVQLREDDGSLLHAPSNKILVTADHPDPMSKGYWPIIAFSPAPTVEAGRLYHLVFSNTDPNRIGNFVSINSAYSKGRPKNTLPNQPDSDLACLLRYQDAHWVPRSSVDGYTPILQLTYADNVTQGMGYIEFWVGNPKTIGGGREVRQVITPALQDLQFSEAWFRLRWWAGTAPLVLSLYREDGTLIEKTQTSVPMVNSYTWVRVPFLTNPILHVGVRYHLLLSTSEGTLLDTFPIRKGADKGFSRSTLFADGWAEFNPGNGWTGWDMWGQPNRRDSDLQFFLR